jgi:hypothetical protein
MSKEKRDAQRLFDQRKVRGSGPAPTIDDLDRVQKSRTVPRLAEGFPSSVERRELLNDRGHLRHRAVGV